jgi:hypothetical protein
MGAGREGTRDHPLPILKESELKIRRKLPNNDNKN